MAAPLAAADVSDANLVKNNCRSLLKIVCPEAVNLAPLQDNLLNRISLNPAILPPNGG
jgi:hypothetical protein